MLNRIAIHRGYALHNFCVICLRSRRRKLLVQMLSPLKFMDQLASNFMRHPGVGLYQSYGNYDFWSVIDVSDRTDQMFKRYLL